MAVLLVISVGLAADTERWTLVVKPSGGGCIDWTTSSPARNGTTSGRKVVSFDTNGFLNVTIEAKTGFELVSFTKDDQEMIWFLDAFNHFEFGPVTGSHTLTATFVPVLPNGTFDLSAPLNNPAVTNMVDLTGSYAGVSPIEKRAYDFDIACDESGKAAVMGTIAGVAPAAGGGVTATGKLKSVNDEPTYDGKLKFKGSRDGEDTKGWMKASGPAELQGAGGDLAQGNISYKGKVGGVTMKDKNVPSETAVDGATQSNVHRDWGIRIDVVERTKSKTAKPYVAASARLTLPNGDVVEFAEKKAKWSAKNGLKLNFKKGTNTSVVPNAVDKKTKVSIKKMTLDKVGDSWFVTGGTMKYAFLGQKGTADVLDFLVK